MVEIKGSELFLSHFLIYSSYSDEFSNNFLSIGRHLETYIAGVEKLLQFLVRVIMFAWFLASLIE